MAESEKTYEVLLQLPQVSNRIDGSAKVLVGSVVLRATQLQPGDDDSPDRKMPGRNQKPRLPGLRRIGLSLHNNTGSGMGSGNEYGYPSRRYW